MNIMEFVLDDLVSINSVLMTASFNWLVFELLEPVCYVSFEAKLSLIDKSRKNRHVMLTFSLTLLRRSSSGLFTLLLSLKSIV